jgi:hypothetical protein
VLVSCAFVDRISFFGNENSSETRIVTGQKPNAETETIRLLIDRRLKTRLAAEAVVAHFDDHLDEDAISAFLEGRLEEAESSSLISHLVQCSPCRNTTAQLVRLESGFDSEIEAGAEESPGRVRTFIENLAARITPSFEEDAVFAYQNPEPDQAAETVNEQPSSKPEAKK